MRSHLFMEIEMHFMADTNRPVDESPDWHEFFGVDPCGAFRFRCKGKRALGHGTLFMLVMRKRSDGTCCTRRVYFAHSPDVDANDSALPLFAKCVETNARWQFFGTLIEVPTTHAGTLTSNRTQLALNPPLRPVLTDTAVRAAQTPGLKVGAKSLLANHLDAFSGGAEMSRLRTIKSAKQIEDQTNEKYLQSLDRAMKERAAGIEPDVDTTFVAGFMKMARSTVTRSIADGRLPTPTNSGGKNKWKLSAIECAREAMLGGSSETKPEKGDTAPSRRRQRKH